MESASNWSLPTDARGVWLCGASAITTMVVISLMVPSHCWCAAKRSKSAGRGGVQRPVDGLPRRSAAAFADEIDPAAVSDAVGDLPSGQIVVLPDGTTLGDPVPERTLVAEVAATGSSAAEFVEGGWELVLRSWYAGEPSSFSTFVPDEVLTEGVARAWLLLGALGLLIVLAAVVVSDRMAKRLVKPLEELSETATRLGAGDLSARVEVSPPREIEELGARSTGWRIDSISCWPRSESRSWTCLTASDPTHRPAAAGRSDLDPSGEVGPRRSGRSDRAGCRPAHRRGSEGPTPGAREM